MLSDSPYKQNKLLIPQSLFLINTINHPFNFKYSFNIWHSILFNEILQWYKAFYRLVIISCRFDNWADSFNSTRKISCIFLFKCTFQSFKEFNWSLSPHWKLGQPGVSKRWIIAVIIKWMKFISSYNHEIFWLILIIAYLKVVRLVLTQQRLSVKTNSLCIINQFLNNYIASISFLTASNSASIFNR